MSLSNTELTNKLSETLLALDEVRKELDELYDYSENLQDSNHIISLRNIQLELLYGTLEKQRRLQ